MIRTKSVYSPIDRKQDGLRVLVARFRGRGLPKDSYDAWVASLGPSEELLRAVQSGAIGWTEFKRRYRRELYEDGGVDERNRQIKNHGQKFTLRLLQVLAERGAVTLMCHCAEDEPNCHRHVLKAILDAKA